MLTGKVNMFNIVFKCINSDILIFFYLISNTVNIDRYKDIYIQIKIYKDRYIDTEIKIDIKNHMK